MIESGLHLVLLTFAAVGFTGAGAAIAVARHRWSTDAERDYGMLGVTAMLLVFGGLCTAVSTGLSGLLAFGGVITWASYVGAAQRIGLFRVEAGTLEAEAAEEPRMRK